MQLPIIQNICSEKFVIYMDVDVDEQIPWFTHRTCCSFKNIYCRQQNGTKRLCWDLLKSWNFTHYTHFSLDSSVRAGVMTEDGDFSQKNTPLKTICLNLKLWCFNKACNWTHLCSAMYWWDGCNRYCFEIIRYIFEMRVISS